MLAEFKYGLVPKESFASYPFLGDQSVPRRYVFSAVRQIQVLMSQSSLYYHFKKDLFPWAYWNYMVGPLFVDTLLNLPNGHLGERHLVWFQRMDPPTVLSTADFLYLRMECILIQALNRPTVYRNMICFSQSPGGGAA